MCTAVGSEPTTARSGSPPADLDLDQMDRTREICGVFETALLSSPEFFNLSEPSGAGAHPSFSEASR